MLSAGMDESNLCIDESAIVPEKDNGFIVFEMYVR